MKFIKIADSKQDIMHIWIEDACNEWFERAIVDMAKGFIKAHPQIKLRFTESDHGNPIIDAKPEKKR